MPTTTKTETQTKTVLFLHAAPGTGFDPDPSATETAGVMLIAPSRPGYGEAAPLPEGRVPTFAAVAERLVPPEPVDLVVGWSSGGNHALALAALYPERVGAVVLVGAPAHDDDVAWIPDQFRSLTEAMRADPANAMAMLTEALEGTGPSPDQLAAGAADDQVLARDPAFAQRLDASLLGAFAQGPVGLATDIVAQHVSDWGFAPSDVAQPVTLVYGGDDEIVTTAHGRHWASVLPRADLRVMENAGHLVVLDAWRRLLA